MYVDRLVVRLRFKEPRPVGKVRLEVGAEISNKPLKRLLHLKDITPARHVFFNRK
jgi:hypothetical protein